MTKFLTSIMIGVILHISSFNKSFISSFQIKSSCRLRFQVSKRISTTKMHLGHSHSHHDHHECDDDDDDEHHNTNGKTGSRPLSLWGKIMGFELMSRTQASVLVSGALVFIPAILRRKVSRFDFGVFIVLASLFSSINGLKRASKRWITGAKRIQQSLIKHSTPLTRKYFFKNDNAADRVTLLGVLINVVLSLGKFFGGIAFNSAVLVADAGHSLSDLVSDFITLWAVQIARLPPDEDHPYGHGKFESVGSLFLSLTLLATGFSVGSWSYDKMCQVITAQGLVNQAQVVDLILPSWPAMLLAAISIGSKEWLFRVTRRVGLAMNSQILVANAWHHRSDAFSSVLSLFSIAAAILVPGFLVADSAAGILVAGMICLTGIEILVESIKQLTDTSDQELGNKIGAVAKEVEGVLDVADVRTRAVGSNCLVDLTVLTDLKISSSAAQSIAERVRWKILEQNSQVVDVVVRTQSSSRVCPLLSHQQRPIADIEREIREHLCSGTNPLVPTAESIKKVTVHYLNSALLCVEIVITAASSLNVDHMRDLAKTVVNDLKKANPDIFQADVHLDLGTSSVDDAANAIALSNLSSPKVAYIA